jgi:serine/threonine-protein kinase
MFARYRLTKAIETLAAGDSTAAQKAQAVSVLKAKPERAIPLLIGALQSPYALPAIEELLARMLNNSTVQHYIDGLSSNNQYVVSAVSRLLTNNTSYDAGRLLRLYDEKEVSNSVLNRILAAQSERVQIGGLLQAVQTAPKDARFALLRLVDQVAKASDIDLLIPVLKEGDPQLRAELVKTIARFPSKRVLLLLMERLKDSNKNVRLAVLVALPELEMEVDLEAVCELLRDGDMTVQAKAIEALSRINDSSAVKFLLKHLQDESEYVRRGAVEVLNAIGDVDAIKDLIEALKDRDWWVRVRAADALGRIGGPKVVEAVLLLIKDEDEFNRRMAVEILNSLKDSRAFEYLCDALEDEDWWVRERAVDALAALGDTRAVPMLIDRLDKDEKAVPVLLRGLATLGDERAVPAVIKCLQNSDKAVRKEAVQALTNLTGEEHLSLVREAVAQLSTVFDEDERERADAAVGTIVERIDNLVAAQESVDDEQTVIRDGNAEEADSTNELVLDPAARRTIATKAQQGDGGPALSFGDNAMAEFLDASKLRTGDELLDRYRVIRHIGKGAFGDVVLVEDSAVNENIVLKFLKPNLSGDADVIKRFVQELRYSRRVTHENIIRIYDFVTIGRSHAMSMEYFDSYSLGVYNKNKRLKHNQKFKILFDICTGIMAAHAVKVVHRDLKPGNILINSQGKVKVVDFGLAAAANSGDSRLTRSGIILGTPAYMSPEQVQGADIDSRTDIYSLGIVMYEMFTGRQPYKGKDPMSILFQHVEGNAKPPSTLSDEVTPGLEDCIKKCMAVKPEDRYQSMSELAQALRLIVKNEGM